MKSRIISSVAVAGTLAIVACSQDSTLTPAVPTEASFSVAPAPVCSFPAIRTSAAAYFASSTDPVYALITAMDKAGQKGPTVRTNSGFEVLARLGAAADVGASAVKGTPAQGSTFANAVLGCMVVSTYTGPIDFSNALGSTGLFAVRDNSGVAPVASRLLGSDGAPAFGAEPGGPGNWPLSGRTLFYGNLLNTPTLAGETAAGTVFDLTTLPSGLTFSPQIKVGVCTLTDPNARILHLHATDPGVILSPVPPLSFCPLPLGARGTSSSFFASAASRLASWLTPAAASAATAAFRLGGGGAGLVGGLSKIGPVSYTSTMAWVIRPGNTSLSTNPQFNPIVTVRNKSANGNALDQATITLVITGNNENFTVTGNTAVTNFEGTARFPNLRIDTAGDYTVTAVSELGGSVSATFTVTP